MSRQHLLFIAPVMPDEAGNGLAMRQGQFLTAYARHFSIDLAVIPIAGPASANRSFASRHAETIEVFAPSGLETHFSLLSRLADPAQKRAAFVAYGRPSIQAKLTFDLRNRFASFLAGRHYNLIHAGRLYMLELAADLPSPCLVDADEDDARVFQQFARQAGQSQAAQWAQIEAENFARQAALTLPRAAHVFAASETDARSLARHGRPVTIIPNIVKPPRLHRRRDRSPRLLFVGTLGWRPNAEGLAWFLKSIWPRLQKRLPTLKLDIVGAGAKLPGHSYPHGVIWHGWQPDLARFYQTASAVIVPIRSGGGSRIKLLEAAGFGCPVIATRIGAEGSALRAGRDYLAANTPTRFIAAILAAQRQPRRLGSAARRTVIRQHSAAAWQARIAAIALAHCV